MNKISLFQSKIWKFYKENKRDFLWRQTTDPYAILVSEMMLQQTQTSRVVEKYQKFLKSFPTVSHLAQAPASEVLMHWQGLGYNRRALYLKRSAEIICETYSRIVPSLKSELITLPGIGPNTAGAVIAFAYNKPEVFIETNIRRVFIHEFFREKDMVSDQEIYPLIITALDEKNPRDWYYALMDYGAYLAKKETNPNRKSQHYKKTVKIRRICQASQGKYSQTPPRKGTIQNSSSRTISKQRTFHKSTCAIGKGGLHKN